MVNFSVHARVGFLERTVKLRRVQMPRVKMNQHVPSQQQYQYQHCQQYQHIHAIAKMVT